MSEELEINHESWLDLIRRITELEKKFEHCNEWRKVELADIKRIEKLEKKYEALKEGESDDIKEIEIFRKELSELRNLIQGNAISDLNHYEANKVEIEQVKMSLQSRIIHINKTIEWNHQQDTEINELKGRMDNFMKNWRGAISPFLKKQRNLEEVLREVMKMMELMGSYTLNTDQFNFIFSETYWNVFKKKLGGDTASSASHTEEKCDFESIDKDCNNKTIAHKKCFGYNNCTDYQHIIADSLDESQPPRYSAAVREAIKNPSEQDAGSARQTADVLRWDADGGDNPFKEVADPDFTEKYRKDWEDAYQNYKIVEKADLEEYLEYLPPRLKVEAKEKYLKEEAESGQEE